MPRENSVTNRAARPFAATRPGNAAVDRGLGKVRSGILSPRAVEPPAGKSQTNGSKSLPLTAAAARSGGMRRITIPIEFGYATKGMNHNT